MNDRIFIGLPYYESIKPATTASLVALTEQLAVNGLFSGYLQLNFGPISDLRNVMLTTWYDKQPSSTHILWIDSDIQFEPDIVREMLFFDKPFVGAVYPKKTYPLSWACSAQHPKEKPENGFMEPEFIGFGLALVRRDCVTAMLEKGLAVSDDKLDGASYGKDLATMGINRVIRAFDHVTTEDGRRLSEDFSFCWRHRQCGGSIYSPINHAVGHIGVTNFIAKYSDNYKDEKPEPKPE